MCCSWRKTVDDWVYLGLGFEHHSVREVKCYLLEMFVMMWHGEREAQARKGMGGYKLDGSISGQESQQGPRTVG